MAVAKTTGEGKALNGTKSPGTSIEKTVPIVSRSPGRLAGIADRIEKFLPAVMIPRRGLFSFKNRILISTLFVVAGVVFTIGIALQTVVFPKLRGDSTVILNLKVIHFLAGLIVIGASWVFAEIISKKISLPLMELTDRADQVSREACEGLSAGFAPESDLHDGRTDDDVAPRDEIMKLTSSFNRMLIHLKASEARLRESEEKYRFLFDAGPSPIFVLDAETLMILDVNARAEEEYQYSRSELLSMSFADLGLDRDREQTTSLLHQLLTTDITLLPVLQHMRRDGSIFMVNYQARPSKYKNRSAIIAAVWDVTEKLEKHAKLIQAGKMATLGEMATGIAHELNQPLNVVKLGCDFLTKKIKTNQEITREDIAQVAKELSAGVERSSKIINHLRQFGRKADNTMSPVNINIPVRNVFHLLGRQLESRGIRWEIDQDDRIPRIMGDINLLEQVFINLVINSRDSMLGVSGGRPSEEKLVRIKTFSQEHRIIVTIEDTGLGIPENIRNKVFEPFFTTKKIGEGTGLGLSISYGIVKEHNGTIELDSSAERGNVFKLTFPAIQESSQFIGTQLETVQTDFF